LYRVLGKARQDFFVMTGLTIRVSAVFKGGVAVEKALKER
jgi:hypothetical protein